MELSIIIPTYNNAQFLRRCLNSISARDDIEVILVDDGSTDGSAQIACEYVDKGGLPLIKFIQASHMGVSAARNLGLKEATGRYITFLDSDDEYTATGIDNMFKAIAQHPNASIIQLNHYRYYPNGVKKIRFYNPAGVYTANKLPDLWMVVWSKLFKREVAEGILFDTKLTHGEDEMYILHCLNRAKKICCVEATNVIHHIDNPGSLTHNVKSISLRDEQEALIDFIEQCEDVALRKAVCQRISILWTTPTYMDVFGDRK